LGGEISVVDLWGGNSRKNIRFGKKRGPWRDESIDNTAPTSPKGDKKGTKGKDERGTNAGNQFWGTRKNPWGNSLRLRNGLNRRDGQTSILLTSKDFIPVGDDRQGKGKSYSLAPGDIRRTSAKILWKKGEWQSPSRIFL